jgi:hypothetical protein
MAKILWGAVSTATGYSDKATWDALQAAAKKPPSLLSLGRSWQNANAPASAIPKYPDHFQTLSSAQFDAAHVRGAIPFLSWLPCKTGRKRVSDPDNIGNNDAIMSGKGWDSYVAYVRGMRDAIMNSACPLVYVCLGVEFNGHWYPYSDGVEGNESGDYKLLFQWIHSKFAETGALYSQGGKIKLVWAPNYFLSGTIADGVKALLPYWPGDRYVDCLGFDAYNQWDENSYKSPEFIFGLTYDILQAISAKPIFIPEWGSLKFKADKVGNSYSDTAGASYTVALSQARFVKDALLWFTSSRAANIIAVSYFNAMGDTNDARHNMRVSVTPTGATFSAQLQEAFAYGLGSSFY